MNESPGSGFENVHQAWLAALDNTYRDLIDGAAAAIPDLLGAGLLVLLGWLLAFALRNAIVRLGTGLDRLFESLRLRSGGAAEGPLRWPVSRIVAVAVYWLVILFFLAAAAEVLGLEVVSGLFGAVLGYLPSLLLTAAALFVIFLLSGAIAGAVERGARGAGVSSAAALGGFVRVTLIVMASIVALGQIGVDATLLVNVFTLVVATFFAGTALAFGLGAAGAVRNIIAAHYARRAYRVGQRVRVAGLEGEILELTSVAVVLDTEAGRTLLPARVFEENPSVLLQSDDDDA